MSDLIDLYRKIQKSKAEALRKVPWQNCKAVRDIGLFLSEKEFEETDSVISAVSSEFDVDEETAEERVIQYNAILSAPKSKVRDVVRSSGYFSGATIEDIATDVNRSSGEIRRELRQFVAQCENEAPHPVEVRTEYPPAEIIREEVRKAIADVLSNVDFDAITDIDRPDVDRGEYPFTWLDFLPADAYYALYEMYDKYGEETVRTALVDYLEENDLHGYIDTSELFRGDRKRLFFEAFEAYREEKYSLCILPC